MFSKYILRDEKGKITGVEYPPELVQIVIEKYPNHTIAECVEFSGLSKGIVYRIACEHRVEKSKEFKQKQIEQVLKVGKNNRYKPGRVPENKGKKWAEFMSPDGQLKSLRTCYKKGNIPHNHRPVGSERITKDGYIEVKTNEPNVFELKHRVVWEQHHGTIPKGSNIQFKDGNGQNCDIDNLYIISRNHQIRNNTIHNYPEEVKKAIRTVSKLNRIIKELE
jgi:hypothetical protein